MFSISNIITYSIFLFLLKLFVTLKDLNTVNTSGWRIPYLCKDNPIHCKIFSILALPIRWQQHTPGHDKQYISRHCQMSPRRVCIRCQQTLPNVTWEGGVCVYVCAVCVSQMSVHCQMSRVCVVSVYQMSVDTAKCHLCVCGVYQMSTGHFWS